MSLIRAEQRFGNGDGIFSLAEQRAASDANYYSNGSFAAGVPGRGTFAFLGAGRRVRLGLENNF